MIYIITGNVISKYMTNTFYNDIKKSIIVECINISSIYFDDVTTEFYIETNEISNKDMEQIENYLDSLSYILKYNIELRKIIKESNISKYDLMSIICNEDLPDVTITSGNNYTKASYSKILEYLKYN